MPDDTTQVIPAAPTPDKTPAQGNAGEPKLTAYDYLFNAKDKEESKDADKTPEAEEKTQTLGEAMGFNAPPKEGGKPGPDDHAPVKADEGAKIKKPKKKVDDGYKPPQPTPQYAPAPEYRPPAPTFNDNILDDDDKEVLNLLRYGSHVKGGKYAGMDAAMERFHDARLAFITKHKADDEDYNPSDDPDYTRWVEKNLPKISGRDLRQLQEEKFRDEIRNETSHEANKIRNELERKEKIPLIAAAVDDFVRKSVADLPDYIVSILRDKEHGGVEAARKKYPNECRIAERHLDAVKDHLKEFLDITNNVTDFKPHDPKHQYILNFVNAECAGFAQHGGPARVRAGKSFVTRETWTTLDAEQRKQAWTFSNADMMDILKYKTKGWIDSDIKRMHSELEAAGWKRGDTPSAPPPPPSRPAPSYAPPAHKPAPSSSPSGKSQPRARSLAGSLLGF